MKQSPPVIDAANMLVSKEALSEIRVNICDSLEMAINMALECSCHSATDLAFLIRPAVERLQAIYKENSFPV